MRFVTLFFLVLSLTLLPRQSALWAQEGEDGALKADEEMLQRAQQIFEEAETAYRLQEFEKALEGYKEVYRLTRSPEILFNLGQCYRQLGRYEEALKSYRAFLRDLPDTEYRASVETIISELEAKQKEQPATSPVLPEELPREKSRLPGLLYGGAAVSGAAMLAFGVAAFSASGQAARLAEVSSPDALPDPAQLQTLAQRARTLGALSDAFLVASVVSGGAGLFLSLRAKKNEVKLSLTPNGALLSGRF